ncbi:MAG TPA: polygalacturonase, partial [Rhizobium sp.]|nr:polygalacturonase [Rhizobium sp.]
MTGNFMSDLHHVSIPVQSGNLSDTLQAIINESTSPLQITLEPGIHRCGGLRLRSNLTLELPKGSELHFIADYDAYAETSVSIVREESDRGMLVAANASNLKIIGGGRIFGDGAASFTHGGDADMGTLVAHKLRPRPLVLEGCR